jgi:non-ribosomal peptide synthase protein (TIGR01720 family)
VPGDGSGYGLLRYLNAETAPVLAAVPRPQIGFNYLGRFPQGTEAAWGVAPESAGLTGGAAPDMPVPHVLEVTALLREDEDGVQRLTASFAWPQGRIDADAVERIADAWIEALRVFARHADDPSAGGHTPSDLAVDLSQDEIDDFEAEMDGLGAEFGFSTEDGWDTPR